MTETERLEDRRHALWLGLTVLLAHGLLLLNDGIYWDGFVVASGRAEPELLRHIFVDAGAAAAYPMHLALNALPGFPFGHKLASFVSALVITFAGRRLALASGYLTRSESTYLAAILCTWPALLPNVELVMVPYAVCFAAFLGGWATLLSPPATTTQTFVRRGIALACIFLSFSVRSLLVVHLGFCVLVVAHRALQDERDMPFWRRCLWQASRVGDLFALPFVYWVSNEAFFPRKGEYATYNRLKVSFGGTARAFVSSGLTAFVRWPLATAKSLVRDPIALVVSVAVAAAAARWVRPVDGEAQPPLRRHWPSLLVGGWLLAVAIAPYALIGAAPLVHGWGRRHGLLTGLGTGVCLVTFAAVLRRWAPPRAANLAWLVPVLWSAANAGALADGFLGWQSRTAKDKAILVRLREVDEGARRASVYFVRDETPRGDEPGYRFYEWASLFELAWGDEGRVGFPEGTPRAEILEHVPYFNHAYNAQNLDIEGCAARLEVISVVPREPDWRLGARYTWARLRGGPDDSWLRSLVSVSIAPLPSADGRNCPRSAPLAP